MFETKPENVKLSSNMSFKNYVINYMYIITVD